MNCEAEASVNDKSVFAMIGLEFESTLALQISLAPPTISLSCYSVAEWYQLIMYSGRFSPLSASLSASFMGNGLRTYAALV
jgi:hypothetical protein